MPNFLQNFKPFLNKYTVVGIHPDSLKRFSCQISKRTAAEAEDYVRDTISDEVWIAGVFDGYIDTKVNRNYADECHV